ncbi:MAG: Ig-like domain-containing protein [Cloacibacillus porcorum]|uniref:GLUG motif-containing protein n=1 Tax=Cloacibacillus porcorum TaxID=1197717 RepID=UPI002356CC1E|nr:Ig-like domain-containing protein [Cloacibacillus porcorum]
MEPASDDRGVYLLSEPGHLLWFRDTVNDVSADIDAKLMNDIDLSDGGSPSHWPPIGKYISGDIWDNGYAGSFDGGGFTVSGYIVTSADVVSADDSGNLAAGFFGLVGQSAEIRGLTVGGVVSVDISGNTDKIYYIHAGGIAGVSIGTITNCDNSGKISASGGKFNNAGGIAGSNAGTITDCTNNCAIAAYGGHLSEHDYAGGIIGYNMDARITNCANSGDVSASGDYKICAGGIAGYNEYVYEYEYSTITNCANSGDVSASGGSDNYAGGIAGYSDSGKITNNAHSGGNVSVSGGHDNNYAGGIAGYNDGTGTITNSCWLASGNLEAIGGGIAVSADVVSLDAAVMEKVVTTVLPAKRTLSVEVGGSAPALISYPGTADDMAGYLSVSGDIFIASPDIADISRGWPCAVSGIKPGVTAVSFDIDLRATDFSDKNNLKPLSAGCATGPLCFTAAVGKVPVSGVSLDFTELALDIGESKKLTATVKPDNATDKEVAWTSANPAVAAVDDMGKVTALSAGTTVITAKAGGVSAACTVTVAHKKTGGSGHGCAAGLGAFPMLALIPLWLRRKKR